MEGSGRGLMKGTISAFDWKDWGNPRKLSVGIADLRAEVWTRDLPNMKQECYLLYRDVRCNAHFNAVKHSVMIWIIRISNNKIWRWVHNLYFNVYNAHLYPPKYTEKCTYRLINTLYTTDMKKNPLKFNISKLNYALNWGKYGNLKSDMPPTS
jgi:hypothetical protein